MGWIFTFPHAHHFFVRYLYCNNYSYFIRLLQTIHYSHVLFNNPSLNSSSSSNYENFYCRRESALWGSQVIPYERVQQSLQLRMVFLAVISNYSVDGRVTPLMPTSTSYTPQIMHTSCSPSTLNYWHPTLPLQISLAHRRLTNVLNLYEPPHMACRDLQRDSCSMREIANNKGMYILNYCPQRELEVRVN